MGRKSKMKNKPSGSESNKAVKRKVANPVANGDKQDEPPTKRNKWFPGKFVLLKPPTSETSESDNELKTTKPDLKTPRPAEPKIKGKKKKQKQLNGNVNDEQLKKDEEELHEKRSVEKKKKNFENLDLKKLYADLSSTDSDDYSMEIGSDDEDVSFESASDDERVEEEWTTDTDYSEEESLDSLEDEDEYSFHESDCESVDSDVSGSKDYWNDMSTDDSDYKPEIEDKYIKYGEAIIYDAKGLDLAFGNSFESQIVEINDINPAIIDKNDEEVPDLIPLEGEELREENECSMEQDDENQLQQESSTLSQEAEDLIKDLEHNDDESSLKYSMLTQCVTFYDCLEDCGVVVKLSSTVHFHGILIIKAIANNVQVNGYTLQPDETITATSISRADYFLNLTPVIENNNSKDNLKAKLYDLLSDDQVDALTSSFKADSEAILYLQHGLPDPTVEMLKIYSPHPLLPSKRMILNNNRHQSSELILSTKFFVASENQKVETFELNEQWSNIGVKADSKLVIAGGKNVGKSNLCQFIINSNITQFKKLLLIDLDIGQPICGPAQTVSATLITKPIIGAGYLSKNQPEKCLLYGDKSVMIAPFKYVRCVRKLVEFCESQPEYKNIPWVINTMGYQKGFGLQLICLLLKVLQPTDVIQIQHGIKSYNFSAILTEETVNKFVFNFFDAEDIAGLPDEVFFTTHVLDSIVNNREGGAPSKWLSNATDKRKLSMLAQLSKVMRCSQVSLNDITPFVAPMSKIRMLVVDEEYSQKEHGFDIDLLNGNLVYLCEADEKLTLNPTTILDCHGVGIVRGVDKINVQVYILLPQNGDVEALQAKVNVLAIGNIPLPAEILLKQNYSITGKIPHVTFFKDRKASSKKYINKRNIKDCY